MHWGLCLVIGEGLNLCFWECEGHFWSWVMATPLPAHAHGVDPVLLGEVLCRLLVSRADSSSIKLYLTILKAPGIPKTWTSAPEPGEKLSVEHRRGPAAKIPAWLPCRSARHREVRPGIAGDRV